MKNSKQFRATSLRMILFASISLTLIISVVGFYFTQDYLKGLAEKNIPNESATAPIATNKNLTDINAVKAEILKYTESGNKANSYFASSQNAQTQITNDIKTYASVSGVNVVSFEFNQTNSSDTTDRPAAKSGPESATITIDKPVKFAKLIKFIKGIESNLPKMQISNITIKPTANSKDLVDVDPITIDYYVR